MIRTLAVLALMLAVPAARSAPPKQDENAKQVDEAIKKALDYLAKAQSPADGSWGPGWGGGRHPAISGLAVMAFLSAGHVPGEGMYGKTVEKGIRAVLKMQHPNGLFSSDAGHEMYHHGICTLMMAEVVGMTQGPLAAEVKKGLEKAVAIILTAQRKPTDGQNNGGWRYRVGGNDADMSVTGWQMMALRAAKNVGCDVPPEAIDRAISYVKRSQTPYNGAFCYTPHGGATVPCTGTGILALSVCSNKSAKKIPEAVKGGDFLMRNPPQWGWGHFSYCMYYCSQAMFQLGGTYWDFFRPKMHLVLLRNQNQKDGSWTSNDGHGQSYATAMAVLALTVEYRFLPIYQRGEEPTDKR